MKGSRDVIAVQGIARLVDSPVLFSGATASSVEQRALLWPFTSVKSFIPSAEHTAIEVFEPFTPLKSLILEVASTAMPSMKLFTEVKRMEAQVAVTSIEGMEPFTSMKSFIA